MTSYKKIEWIHYAIQEALNGNTSQLKQALELLEEIREPYLEDKNEPIQKKVNDGLDIFGPEA